MFNSRILLSQVSPWIIWIAAHSGLLISFNVPFWPAVADAALFSSLLFISAWSISLILRTYRPYWKRSFAVLAWNATLAFLVASAYRWISSLILQHGSRIIDKTEHGFTLLVILSFLVLTSSSLLTWLWFTLKEREESEKWKSDTERLAREAELFGLRQQLQPHFLFNSLNSISALLNDPDEARKMLQLLSDFLRGTVKKDATMKVSLKEELHQVELYFKIEQVRFGHRLNTLIEAKPEDENSSVPALLLQPLVENAIKFGLYGTTGIVEITIKVSTENGMLEIQISNPFDADSSPRQGGTGFGLQSVQRRLYLLYSRKDLLETRNENGTFITRVRIPQTSVKS